MSTKVAFSCQTIGEARPEMQREMNNKESLLITAFRANRAFAVANRFQNLARTFGGH